MSVGRYALGVCALLIVVGSMLVSAVTLRQRWFSHWSGSMAHLTDAVLALALLIAMLELLGLIGLFRLGPIVITSLLIAFAIHRAVGGARFVAARAARGRESDPALRAATLIALLAAAVVAAEWGALTLQSYDVGVRTFDSLWYHLPWAASFAQTGHITPLRFTDVEYLTAFYPATAELLHGLGIVLFGRDTLSPGLNLVWLGLVLLAAYSIGRARGVGPASLTAAVLALAVPMINFSQAGSAANDIVGVFFFLASVALLLDANGRRAAFVLAGISAGLALSVKLSLVGPVLALTVGVIALAPRARRLRDGAVWVGLLVLASGFWYVRNLFAAGNPIPWVSFGVLPTPDPPLQQHTAFTIAHYLGDSRVWSHVFQPGLAAGLGPWWWAIVALMLIGPVLCLMRGADRTLRVLALVALACTAAYVVTPESAAGPAGNPLGFAFNLRYAAPALILSLTILPLAPALAGERRQAATLAGLLAVLVATLAQGRIWPSQHLAAALALGAALLAVALVPAQRRAVVLLVGGAALLIAGFPWQKHYLRGRYAFQPGVSYLAPMWAFFRGVHHARVGVAGTFGGFFSYPLYGLDDSNRVQYIAHRGRHGSFTPIDACSAWRAAVNAGHYRYVVTTPARDPWHPKALGPSPEAGWTASDRGAALVYTRRAVGQLISVYRLSGPLEPRC